MIGISFRSWAFSKFYEVLGGYMIAKRYYYKDKWTPFIFLRWKSYGVAKEEDKITWSEIKSVCTSLDNIFYGAMIYAIAGLLYWFWMLMGIWLIATPIIYVITCYLGYYIKLYIKSNKNDTGSRKA
jgi:hypothetical protein